MCFIKIKFLFCLTTFNLRKIITMVKRKTIYTFEAH